MYRGPQAFLKAVAELSRLPGIGERTAQRLAFYLVDEGSDYAKALAEAIVDLKSKIFLCSVCCGLTDADPCPICRDSHRDSELICVVEDPSDQMAVERSGQFRGLYHVLHGCLAPLDGVGPEKLKVAELLKRVETKPVKEVVLATNPNVEGEATALYLARLLKERGVRTSRIALGLPMGGHLEYADQVTIGRAISERRGFSTT
ncbi:MAG: recombination mediator RecR [Pseudomonadota bacterium]